MPNFIALKVISDSRARSSFAFVWWWWSSSVWRRRSVTVITTSGSRSRSVSTAIAWSVAITWSATTFAAITTFASNVNPWCWAMCSFCDRIINSNLMSVYIKPSGVLLSIDCIFNIFICDKSKSSGFISLLIVNQGTALKFSISLKNSSKFVFSSSSPQIEDSEASRSWWIFTIAKMTLLLVFCWRNRSWSMATSIATSRSASSWWPTSWSRIRLGSSSSPRWVVWWFRSSSSSATAIWPGFTPGHFSWAWHFWYIKFR